MPGTEDIWEFRTFFNKSYYRIFAFWFRKDGQDTLIVCTNGLIKKTDKTPSGEIERAERIKSEYISNN
jgi:phage-related protein